MTRRSALLSLALLTVVFAGAATALQSDLLGSTTSRPGTVVLIDPAKTAQAWPVEVAETPGAQKRGLMYRHRVRQGMVFAFSEEKPLNFWMKNTYVPLDIAFFNGSGSFVSSTSMEPCTEDPCPSYSSGSPAKIALEMPAGFLARTGLGEGWKLLLR